MAFEFSNNKKEDKKHLSRREILKGLVSGAVGAGLGSFGGSDAQAAGIDSPNAFEIFGIVLINLTGVNLLELYSRN